MNTSLSIIHTSIPNLSWGQLLFLLIYRQANLSKWKLDGVTQTLHSLESSDNMSDEHTNTFWKLSNELTFAKEMDKPFGFLVTVRFVHCKYNT